MIIFFFFFARKSLHLRDENLTTCNLNLINRISTDRGTDVRSFQLPNHSIQKNLTHNKIIINKQFGGRNINLIITFIYYYYEFTKKKNKIVDDLASVIFK